MGKLVTVTGDNLTVDLLLDREYGVEGRKLVVATLKLNPHLSGLDAILPPGTVVDIPPMPAVTSEPKKLRSLFG